MFSDPILLLSIWDSVPLSLDTYSREDSLIQKYLNSKQIGVYSYVPLQGDFTEKHVWTQQNRWDSILITPTTHKWIVFEVTQRNGTISKVQLLRPNAWIVKEKINQISSSYYLDLPDIKIKGYGRVISILPCLLDSRLWDERRNGDYILEPITSKFEHIGKVDHYRFENEIEIVSSPAHEIWNDSRKNWIPIGLWEKEEKGHFGKENKGIKLKDIISINNEIPIFNISVAHSHNYQVTDSLLLVHNGPCPYIDDLLRDLYIPYPEGINHPFYYAQALNEAERILMREIDPSDIIPHSHFLEDIEAVFLKPENFVDHYLKHGGGVVRNERGVFIMRPDFFNNNTYKGNIVDYLNDGIMIQQYVKDNLPAIDSRLPLYVFHDGYYLSGKYLRERHVYCVNLYYPGFNGAALTGYVDARSLQVKTVFVPTPR